MDVLQVLHVTLLPPLNVLVATLDELYLKELLTHVHVRVNLKGVKGTWTFGLTFLFSSSLLIASSVLRNLYPFSV